MNSSKQRSVRSLLASAFALSIVAFAPHAGALQLTIGAPTTQLSVGSNDFFADGLSRTFGVAPLTLNLQGAAGATATYTFLFQESGFSNRFVAEGATLNDGDPMGASVSRTYTGNGALNFSFVSPLGTATNSGNNSTEPNFGILLGANLNTLPAGPVRTALATRGLLGTYDAILFFNDGGAGSDRDFDDMVLGVNLLAVPEPGLFAMLVAGLLMLVWIGRRRIR